MYPVSMSCYVCILRPMYALVVHGDMDGVCIATSDSPEVKHSKAIGGN